MPVVQCKPQGACPSVPRRSEGPVTWSKQDVRAYAQQVDLLSPPPAALRLACIDVLAKAPVTQKDNEAIARLLGADKALLDVVRLIRARPDAQQRALIGSFKDYHWTASYASGFRDALRTLARTQAPNLTAEERAWLAVTSAEPPPRTDDVVAKNMSFRERQAARATGDQPQWAGRTEHFVYADACERAITSNTHGGNERWGTRSSYLECVGFVSAQVGKQNELTFGRSYEVHTATPAHGGRELRYGALETLSARVHAGLVNDDGSYGFNLGAVVTVVSETTTKNDDHFSRRAGSAGLDVGFGLSVGSRKLNGVVQGCMSVRLPLFSHGGCW